MNFLLKYFDKRTAATRALQDFATMDMIIKSTPTDIIHIRSDAATLASPQLGTRSSKNPHPLEDRIVASLDRVDLRIERYHEAKAYMDWFLPAWQILSDEDRFVFEAFYLAEGSKDTAQRVADHFYVEKDSVYRRKNRALDRLTTALFGSS